MQPHDLSPAPTLRVIDPRRARRQRIALVLLWLVTVVLAWLFGRFLVIPGSDGVQSRLVQAQQQTSVLRDRLGETEQRIAVLERAEQIARLANENIQTALTEKDGVIAGLRRDLALYERLVGPNAAGQGLAIHELALTPTDNGVIALDVVLTQTRDVSDGASGRLTVSVEGQREGRIETLDWPELAPAGAQDGFAFEFRYFQRLQGSFILPRDFQPHSVEVSVLGRSGDTVKRTLRWDQALGSVDTSRAGPAGNA